MRLEDELRELVLTWNFATPLDADEGATRILEKHADIRGDDATWYREGMFRLVRDRLAKAMPHYDNPAEPAQGKFKSAGFTYLRSIYPVHRSKEFIVELRDLLPSERITQKKLPMRDGKYVVQRPHWFMVKLEQMTDAEIIEKEKLYTDNIEGLQTHRSELQTYRKLRRKKAA